MVSLKYRYRADLSKFEEPTNKHLLQNKQAIKTIDHIIQDFLKKSKIKKNNIKENFQIFFMSIFILAAISLFIINIWILSFNIFLFLFTIFLYIFGMLLPVFCNFYDSKENYKIAKNFFEKNKEKYNFLLKSFNFSVYFKLFTKIERNGFRAGNRYRKRAEIVIDGFIEFRSIGEAEEKWNGNAGGGFLGRPLAVDSIAEIYCVLPKNKNSVGVKQNLGLLNINNRNSRVSYSPYGPYFHYRDYC